MTARSPLRLRLLLSAGAAPVFTAAAAAALILACRGVAPVPGWITVAVICLGTAAAASIDLLVLRRRLAPREPEVPAAREAGRHRPARARRRGGSP